MRIITGSTGTPHVTSNDDGEKNQFIFTDESFIMSNGNRLEASIVDNNTINVKDGDLMIQGRHALINPNTTEDVMIETGEVGLNRHDLIVARYSVAVDTGYESINLVTIKGTPTEGNPTDPAYNEGDIRTGATLVDFPLYRVTITGITLSDLELLAPIRETIQDQIFQTNDELAEQQEQITQLNSDLSELETMVERLVLDKLYPIGSIYLETTNTNPSAKLGGTWVAYGASDTYLRLGNATSGGSNTTSYTPSGNVGGHALTVAEMPQHKHDVSVTSSGGVTNGISSSGAHGHTVPNHTHTMQNGGIHSHNYNGSQFLWDGAGIATGMYFGSATTTNPGYDIGIKNAGSHAHTMNSSGSCTITSSGAHTHSTPNHTHTISENNKGSGNSHDHGFTGTQASISVEPKYVGVYAWKRTA